MKLSKSLIFLAFPLLSFRLVANEGQIEGPLIQIIERLKRADYEGNQAAMRKAFDDLSPFVRDESVAALVRYWSGFAMWRRAVNGFNDSVDQKELAEDLKQAIEEFRAAAASDPNFVEAKVGLISCFGYQAFISRGDATRIHELYGQSAPVIKEAKEMAPENPRLLWVLGPIIWNTPEERGGGQEKAIANYEKGLEFARRRKSAEGLDPDWGEPELLMSLAWSQLNRRNPDLDTAERQARAALQLVPYWHYVRDILMPQIVAARTKTK